MDSTNSTYEGVLNYETVDGRSMRYIYMMKIESTILGKDMRKNLQIFLIYALLELFLNNIWLRYAKN